MLETIRNAWRIPELRKKLMMTAFIILIFRLGNNIPVPYVDTALLSTYFASSSATILGMMNVMSGGAFGRATLLALGIQPYINSSIIIQLLTIAIPSSGAAGQGGRRGRQAKDCRHHPLCHRHHRPAPGLRLLYAVPEQRLPDG